MRIGSVLRSYMHHEWAHLVRWLTTLKWLTTHIQHRDVFDKDLWLVPPWSSVVTPQQQA